MEPLDTSSIRANYTFACWVGEGAFFMDDSHEVKWFPYKSRKEIYVHGKTWKRIGVRDFFKYASRELVLEFHEFRFIR